MEYSLAKALFSPSYVRGGVCCLFPSCACAAMDQRQAISNWIRPGCGLYSSTLLSVAADLHMRVLLGDVYGHDCQMGWWPGFLRWFYTWRAAHGSVVIVHDGTKSRAINTANIIRSLSAAGYKLVAPPS